MLWKFGKTKYGFLETATSGGTLTLLADSAQFQIFTGSMSHDLVLPDATTTSNGSGIAFTVINESTGAITVRLDDNTVLTTVAAGTSLEIILTSHSTSNGVWRVATFTGTSGGGMGSVSPGAIITSNYPIVSGDSGRVLNVNSAAGVVTVTLPAPTLGFVVTIKDYSGSSFVNAITIARNGSELIDGAASNSSITQSLASKTLISDGTNWFIISKFYLAFAMALFSGGNGGSDLNLMDYVNIPILSNAATFGTLSFLRKGIGSCGSSTRGVNMGGRVTGVADSNVIDYVLFSTLANAVDFGDTTVARQVGGGCGNDTRGILGGGLTGTFSAVIDYITIASTGNATSFGNLSVARYGLDACASSTRGIFAGGTSSGGVEDTIDYITIASTGNAIDFGNLSVARANGGGGASSATRGLFFGGQDVSTFSNVIDYITIASTGNATDFGDLTVARDESAAASSLIRAVCSSGQDISTFSNVIDYVTIATTGNAVDFGDSTAAREDIGGCSNAHGGL